MCSVPVHKIRAVSPSAASMRIPEVSTTVAALVTRAPYSWREPERESLHTTKWWLPFQTTAGCRTRRGGGARPSVDRDQLRAVAAAEGHRQIVAVLALRADLGDDPRRRGLRPLPVCRLPEGGRDQLLGVV